MLKRYQTLCSGLVGTADALIIVSAWPAAYWLRFYVPVFAVTKGLPTFSTYLSLTPLVAVVWLAVFTAMRVYSFGGRLAPVREMLLVLKAHGLALLLFMSLTYLFDQYQYSRLVTMYFGVLSGAALVLGRLIVRGGFRFLHTRGINVRRVLVVGEGPSAESVIRRLDDFPEIGLQVIGVVTHADSSAWEVGRKQVLGCFDQITQIIEKFKVEEVLIALPSSQQNDVAYLLEQLKDETLDVRLIPDVHAYVTLGCDVEDFDGVPVLRINDSPLFVWRAAAKRCTDILVAAIALAVFFPLMLLIGMLVKLTSRGPMLYRQERMGLDGRTFMMLKFRSMKIDAESRTGAVWAQQSDDRKTVIGAFLRKTSLDELPQLWNVLRGEMSLVGPRPERPVFVKQFRKEIPHYMLRHKVKAGITGWAQVNGWRGNTSLSRRVECDLYYIQNWSYLLDLKILSLTIWKGFVNKNAY